LVRRWRSKVRASAHSWTVPVNPPQPSCCCHRAAAVAQCPTTALCAAATAADTSAKLLPTSRYHAAATAIASALLQSRCRRHAVHRRNALRCRHRRSCCHCRRTAAKLPPTLRCHAAATAAASALGPLCCRRCAVRHRCALRCRHHC
jgi:hypothetical protein